MPKITLSEKEQIETLVSLLLSDDYWALITKPNDGLYHLLALEADARADVDWNGKTNKAFEAPTVEELLAKVRVWQVERRLS